MEENRASKGQAPSVQHGRPLLSRSRFDASDVAVFVCAISGGGGRFGQLPEERGNTITQTNIVLCIKHVEHMVGVYISVWLPKCETIEKS